MDQTPPNNNPIQLVKEPLPSGLDTTMVLIALAMAGNLIMEFKDAEGKIIETRPVVAWGQDQAKKVTTCNIPMALVRDLMKRDFEIHISNLRPANNEKGETLVLSITEKESKLILDGQLPPKEIEKIKQAAARFRSRLN